MKETYFPCWKGRRNSRSIKKVFAQFLWLSFHLSCCYCCCFFVFINFAIYFVPRFFLLFLFCCYLFVDFWSNHLIVSICDFPFIKENWRIYLIMFFLYVLAFSFVVELVIVLIIDRVLCKLLFNDDKKSR